MENLINRIEDIKDSILKFVPAKYISVWILCVWNTN
jgi:hypothetical protein